MNSPTFQDKLTAALHNWSVGQRQDLKDLLSTNTNILSTYKGRGNIESYFFPVLYIRELCTDLMSVGFPIEEVLDHNRGDFMWVDWPEVVSYMTKYNPDVLRDLAADGVFSEDSIGDVEPLGCFSVDDNENTEILYDYWPRLIQEAVQEQAEKFVNSSSDVWETRHKTVVAAIQTVARSKKIR